ncbi:MAG: tyrosine recombinase XerC [Candidatus Elarobacter sp.]
MAKVRRRYDVAAFASADPAIARFAQHLELRRMSPKTSVAYQRDLESYGSFLKARAGDLDQDTHHPPPYDQIEAATQSDIIAYLQRLNASRSYAPRSLHRKVSALRTFYKFLKFDGRRSDNPASDVPSPKIGKSLPKALTEGDINTILEVAVAGLTDLQRRRDRAILHCLYSSGVRRSELLGLTLSDIDLDGRVMRVIGGKGNKDRGVPLTVEAANAIRDYLGVRPRSPGDWLFVGRGGARLSESAVYKIVRTYFGIAGIEGHASPHTMRHSIATHLYEHGADLLVIQEILGHASLATTQVYTRVAKKRMMEQFDASHPRSKRS